MLVRLRAASVPGGLEANHGREPSFADELIAHGVGLYKSERGTVQDVSGPLFGRKTSELTQEAFDSLLAFLGATPEEAGRKYEEIRRRLVKIFASRGCPTPEELVDESIDRVARKAAELAFTYEGDPALYFYGVARRVYLESLKKRPAPAPPPPSSSSQERQQELDCLDECMRSLPPAQRTLIYDYYREEKRAKIEQRRALAARLGIGVNALRIRAHRIRAELQSCVTACLERCDDGSVTPFT